MSDDFDLEIRRRSGSYLIVARDVGVIVRNSDLNAGLQEARERIALVMDLYRQAGLAPERADPALHQAEAETRTGINWRDVLAPTLVSGLTLAGLILFASVPMVGAAARLTSAISILGGTLGEARTGLDATSVGRNTIDSIITLGYAMDKVTPERKRELRTAVRSIMGGLSPIIEEVRAGANEKDSPAAPLPH